MERHTNIQAKDRTNAALHLCNCEQVGVEVPKSAAGTLTMTGSATAAVPPAVPLNVVGKKSHCKVENMEEVCITPSDSPLRGQCGCRSLACPLTQVGARLKAIPSTKAMGAPF